MLLTWTLTPAQFAASPPSFKNAAQMGRGDGCDHLPEEAREAFDAPKKLGWKGERTLRGRSCTSQFLMPQQLGRPNSRPALDIHTRNLRLMLEVQRQCRRRIAEIWALETRVVEILKEHAPGARLRRRNAAERPTLAVDISPKETELIARLIGKPSIRSIAVARQSRMHGSFGDTTEGGANSTGAL